MQDTISVLDSRRYQARDRPTRDSSKPCCSRVVRKNKPDIQDEHRPARPKLSLPTRAFQVQHPSLTRRARVAETRRCVHPSHHQRRGLVWFRYVDDEMGIKTYSG